MMAFSIADLLRVVTFACLYFAVFRLLAHHNDALIVSIVASLFLAALAFQILLMCWLVLRLGVAYFQGENFPTCEWGILCRLVICTLPTYILLGAFTTVIFAASIVSAHQQIALNTLTTVGMIMLILSVFGFAGVFDTKYPAVAVPFRPLFNALVAISIFNAAAPVALIAFGIVAGIVYAIFEMITLTN